MKCIRTFFRLGEWWLGYFSIAQTYWEGTHEKSKYLYRHTPAVVTAYDTFACEGVDNLPYQGPECGEDEERLGDSITSSSLYW
jgi:hypothetical protein